MGRVRQCSTMCDPSRSNFFNFHAVFLVKNLQNNRFEYPTLGLTPNQYKPSDFKCDVTKGRLMECYFLSRLHYLVAESEWVVIKTTTTK